MPVTKSPLSIALMLFVGMAAVAQAETSKVTAEASANATIQTAGPRPGYQGKIFYNAASPACDKGPSFAVADFKVSDFKVAKEIKDVSGISLKLVQTNAWFTKPGAVKFFIVSETAVSFDEKDCTLKFDSKSLPHGIGKQLGTMYELGKVEFKGEVPEEEDEKGKEKTDSFTFKITPELKAFLLKALNDPKAKIRLVAAPNDDKVSSTWGGAEHRRVDGPKLTFEVATK